MLPFANLSADPENEYFSNGITDEIISALATVKGLRVPGRTSTFALQNQRVDVREVGKRLDVKTVLEGSVRRAGRRVRINAQLINVADGYQLWSERFDRELEDVFDLQDEIARAIVHRLEVSLSNRREPRLVGAATENVQAYEEYLRGRFACEQRGRRLLDAARHLERAIQLDPGFAGAHAALAEARAIAGFYGIVRPHDVMPKAREAAQRALALNPELAEAHNALGHVHLLYDWDWDAAESSYERALSLKPTYSQALIAKGFYLHYLARGEVDEGVRLTRAAVQHDPLNPTSVASLGGILLSVGELDEAYAILSKATRVHPQSFMIFRTLGACAVQRKQYKAAEHAFETSMSLSGRHFWPLSDLIELRVLEGQSDRAALLQAELIERSKSEYVPNHTLCLYHAISRQRKEAIDLFERAVAERGSTLVAAKRWPTSARSLEALAPDARLDELLSQIGFPDSDSRAQSSRL